MNLVALALGEPFSLSVFLLGVAEPLESPFLDFLGVEGEFSSFLALGPAARLGGVGVPGVHSSAESGVSFRLGGMA